MTKRHAIVVEKAKSNYAAYVPDLPGCVATGATVEETERRLRQAIEIHVLGLREDGLPVPEPSSVVDYVEIPAQPGAASDPGSRPTAWA
jgi:predicted RNase H-like HicB family nuclease